MRHEWVHECLRQSREKADFYSGCRKILQNVHFTINNFNSDLDMRDCGFTKSKTSMLMRNYYHLESIRVAQGLWEERVEKNKYGSVGFTTYNHFVKGDVKGATPRGSKMGPCIQSVTLSLVSGRDRHTVVDCFYRTTELFKKFPADLVFIRDNLLSQFEFNHAPVRSVNFHFANVTCHPMYFVTLIPHLGDPLHELRLIKRHDKFFHDWLIKWSSRYICPEHHRGIAKFSQALRVQKDALERIDKKTLAELRKYFRDNHPGHRKDYEEDDDE